ncbi:MAG: hypothetical protein PHU46_05100 [Rhodocyclaceae bacterium]|nr:hypothetical protein [Rhodocyclaceae bacterium]
MNKDLRGTLAHTPDLDWSQVRETVLMLELAAGQIEAAMRDSSSSVDILTGTFTSMADSLSSISQSVEAIPDTGDNHQARGELAAATGQVTGLVHQAIIAFQFYDKLSQRLAHVCASLGSLSSLVSDRARLFNPEEWVGLQQRIRSRYTTRDEVEMFESVMTGTPVLEAIEKYLVAVQARAAETGGDEIELF